MTIKLIDIIIILIAHYIGDFLCQSRNMANNKSKNFYWLITHIIVYTIVLFILILPTGYNLGALLTFTTINGLSHMVIDKITSTFTTKFYNKHQIGKMFNVVGVDQILHIVILLATACYLFR